MNLIGEILQFPLNLEEEECFTRYLRETTMLNERSSSGITKEISMNSIEYLFLYWIARQRYATAIEDCYPESSSGNAIGTASSASASSSVKTSILSLMQHCLKASPMSSSRENGIAVPQYYAHSQQQRLRAPLQSQRPINSLGLSLDRGSIGSSSSMASNLRHSTAKSGTAKSSSSALLKPSVHFQSSVSAEAKNRTPFPLLQSSLLSSTSTDFHQQSQSHSKHMSLNIPEKSNNSLDENHRISDSLLSKPTAIRGRTEILGIFQKDKPNSIKSEMMTNEKLGSKLVVKDEMPIETTFSTPPPFDTQMNNLSVNRGTISFRRSKMNGTSVEATPKRKSARLSSTPTDKYPTPNRFSHRQSISIRANANASRIPSNESTSYSNESSVIEERIISVSPSPSRKLDSYQNAPDSQKLQRTHSMKTRRTALLSQ